MSTGVRRKPLPSSSSSGSIATKAAEPPPPPATPPSAPGTATATTAITTIDIPDSHDSPPPPPPPPPPAAPLPADPEKASPHSNPDTANSSATDLEDGLSDPSAKKPLPPLPPLHKPHQRYLILLRTHWQSASKQRKRLYVLAGLTLLVILILSIALGTSLKKGSKKKKHHNYDLSPGSTHEGDLTYYDPGLGACGITSSSADYICAISYHLFDAYATGPNPNTNPLCGRRLWFARTTGPGAVAKGSGGSVNVDPAQLQGEKVEVVIVDRCAGCEGEGDLDVTETAFGKVAGVAEGRVGVVWGWVD